MGVHSEFVVHCWRKIFFGWFWIGSCDWYKAPDLFRRNIETEFEILFNKQSLAWVCNSLPPKSFLKPPTSSLPPNWNKNTTDSSSKNCRFNVPREYYGCRCLAYRHGSDLTTKVNHWSSSPEAPGLGFYGHWRCYMTPSEWWCCRKIKTRAFFLFQTPLFLNYLLLRISLVQRFLTFSSRNLWELSAEAEASYSLLRRSTTKA